MSRELIGAIVFNEYYKNSLLVITDISSRYAFKVVRVGQVSDGCCGPLIPAGIVFDTECYLDTTTYTLNKPLYDYYSIVGRIDKKYLTFFREGVCYVR
jgi:hypothetical protein